MRASLAAAVAGLFVSTAQAGAVVETVSRDMPGGKETSSTVLYVDGGKLRVEHQEKAASSAEGGTIFKNDVLYTLDHDKKTYTMIDRATMKQMAVKMNEAMAQVEDQLANMPPEQREMVERMMGRSGEGARAKPQYTKTARTETVAGKKCRLWEGARDERKFVEYCVVPFDSIDGGQEVMAAMKNMMGLMEELYEAMNDSGVKDALFTNEWEGVKAIDGYPVLIRTFENGQPASEDLLKSARSAAVPASQFEVPAGYKQEKMEGLQPP